MKSPGLQHEVCDTRGGLRIVAAQGEMRFGLGGRLLYERAPSKGFVTQERKECGSVLQAQTLAGACGGVSEALFQVGHDGLRSEFVQTGRDTQRGGQRRRAKAGSRDKAGMAKY